MLKVPPLGPPNTTLPCLRCPLCQVRPLPPLSYEHVCHSCKTGDVCQALKCVNCGNNHKATSISFRPNAKKYANSIKSPLGSEFFSANLSFLMTLDSTHLLSTLSNPYERAT